MLELLISDLSRGGAGVAKDADGRVVFVPFTAPGDRVRVEIVESHKRYAQGKLVEILEPSPERVNPRCPAFGRCGGCQWQHISYATQWKTKSSGVLHALTRTSTKRCLAPLEEMPAERVWEYRNRVQLRGEKGSIGFYAKGSHDMIQIERCEIARPEINSRLPDIRSHGLRRTKPYKVEVEVFADGRVAETWNQGHSASGFRQVHDEQNEKLRHWVAAQIPKGSAVLDLFGGSGNLSLLVSENDPTAEIHCVDVTAPTTPGSVPSFHFHRSAVMPWLLKNRDLARGRASWTAVLDPPRDGLAEEFTDIAGALEAWGVQKILFIGCEPDSWARDVSKFQKRGWELEKVGALDLFPQTTHVESLAVLSLSL
jgi:23S rRNA (uracil1939-C5)-methyltransferase